MLLVFLSLCLCPSVQWVDAESSGQSKTLEGVRSGGLRMSPHGKWSCISWLNFGTKSMWREGFIHLHEILILLSAHVMWKNKQTTTTHIPKLNKKREELCLLPVLQVVSEINGMQSDKGGHSRSVHSQVPWNQHQGWRGIYAEPTG